MKKTVSNMYKLIEGEIKRIHPFCPRCGKGVFMADMGDFWSCGKCGDRYNKNYLTTSTCVRAKVDYV